MGYTQFLEPCWAAQFITPSAINECESSCDFPFTAQEVPYSIDLSVAQNLGYSLSKKNMEQKHDGSCSENGPCPQEKSDDVSELDGLIDAFHFDPIDLSQPTCTNTGISGKKMKTFGLQSTI